VLERVVLHQTRFRIPGLASDERGIALGSHGLVLFSSIDRLVTFLAAYSAGHALDAFAASLRIDVVVSALGLHEIALSFEAGSADRMDGVSDVARVSGGLVFTGTHRHFVEYRSAAAPFGWDTDELLPGAQALALYHSTFSQLYDVERTVEVRGFVLRLEPRRDRWTKSARGPRLLLVEGGLGPVLSKYFARAGFAANVAIVDLPAAPARSAPTPAWLFDVPDLPARFSGLPSTPGVRAFVPVSAGLAVEEGFRHPFNLRAFPFFSATSLVLLRGHEPALDIDRKPAFAPVGSVLGAALHAGAVGAAAHAAPPPSFGLPLRLARSADGCEPTAELVATSALPVLRRLAYVLPAAVLRTTRIAFTDEGAFLVGERSLATIPLGGFFAPVAPRIFAPLGREIVPRVSEAALAVAIGAPANTVTFFLDDGRIVALDEASFAPLDRALVEGAVWAPLPAEALDVALPEPSTVALEPLGFRPLSRARPASERTRGPPHRNFE